MGLLQADCSRCAALCCVLLPFDQGPAFGFAKAGGEVCRHLDGGCRCRIHDRLNQGFSGCIAFDCHGAGQRVVTEVFGGRSWRDDPGLMGRIGDAFRAMRKLHEAAWLLERAGGLALPERAEAERARLALALKVGKVRDEAELAALEDAPVLAEVRRFLAGLRQVVSRR